MTINKARVFLLVPFLTSLIIHVMAVMTVYHAGAIYRDDLTTLLPKILTIYSVHLAAVFGGIFGQHSRGGEQAPVAAFWIALAVTSLWNLLLVWRSIVFGLIAFNIGEDRINDYMAYLDIISASGAFLVVGALAYFFSK